ncbi:hypothetical protein VZG28_05270 [Synechococcus elongatus IITB4]|uniref:hypothetical protein n=1 Tax=Synechococcus elongatus TaxID=32046 RepID=UPI0030CC631C
MKYQRIVDQEKRQGFWRHYRIIDRDGDWEVWKRSTFLTSYNSFSWGLSALIALLVLVPPYSLESLQSGLVLAGFFELTRIFLGAFFMLDFRSPNKCGIVELFYTNFSFYCFENSSDEAVARVAKLKAEDEEKKTKGKKIYHL